MFYLQYKTVPTYSSKTWLFGLTCNTKTCLQTSDKKRWYKHIDKVHCRGSLKHFNEVYKRIDDV